jgi:hypothetical protein
VDVAGVFATDGLTIRWVPGTDTAQLKGYTLYADGVQIGTFGPTTYEAKLGQSSAADARRFWLTETTTAGAESGPSAVLRVVPALAGLNVEQANAALTARNLVGGAVSTVPSLAPAGTVVGPSDLAVVAEGTSVPLQVSGSGVARAPFAFSAASAPRVTLAPGALAARVSLTSASRIDVTLDAYPYKRLHRWHFFHVTAGHSVLRLRLAQPLRAGQYRLFWKATSDADRSVRRQITPLSVARSAKASRSAKLLTVSAAGARTPQSTGSMLYETSVEQAFLYATYHDVRGFVLAADAFDPATVRALRAVYPHRAVIVLTDATSVARSARAAGASTLPAHASAATVASLVAKLDG